MSLTVLEGVEESVRVSAGGVAVDGDLVLPEGATGIVLFAHGSGSSRVSPRNRFVAGDLARRGLATLLIDLLTEEEEAEDRKTANLRFDIGLLAGRLAGATTWLSRNRETRNLRIGYFGASTGAAAALVAAAARPGDVAAVVSRGGRPDLAAEALPRVAAPTLLIVGEDDLDVLELNREACDRLSCEKKLEIVPNASHLFEEPGALETVAGLAGDWFVKHLRPAGRKSPS